jgi:hypothetical protein
VVFDRRPVMSSTTRGTSPPSPRSPTTRRDASYDRKLAEAKSRKEALRALKRRISDAVYRQLRADSHR